MLLLVLNADMAMPVVYFWFLVFFFFFCCAQIHVMSCFEYIVTCYQAIRSEKVPKRPMGEPCRIFTQLCTPPHTPPLFFSHQAGIPKDKSERGGLILFEYNISIFASRSYSPSPLQTH